MLRTELFFGRNAGGALRVSDAEWRDFVVGSLSARFPSFTEAAFATVRIARMVRPWRPMILPMSS